MKNVRQFEAKDDDGLRMARFCVSKLGHIEKLGDTWDGVSYHLIGACDGSCSDEARKFDLRAFIVTAQTETLSCEHRVLSSAVHIDGRCRALLRSDTSLIGMKFSGGYAKRNGEWHNVCLGTVHAYVSTDFRPWFESDGARRFQTHKIVTTDCDGSCRRTAEWSMRKIESRLHHEPSCVRDPLDRVTSMLEEFRLSRRAKRDFAALFVDE